jgi:hypothetical protein
LNSAEHQLIGGKIVSKHVYEAEVTKGVRIARKRQRRVGTEDDEKRIRDKPSRKGRGKARRGLINEAAGPQQAKFGDLECMRE